MDIRDSSILFILFILSIPDLYRLSTYVQPESVRHLAREGFLLNFCACSPLALNPLSGEVP